MRYFRIAAVVLAAALALAAVAGAAATTASATTLTCTQTKTSFATPYGCGGLQLQYQVKGILDMAADGNYWNAAVRVSTGSLTSTSQDWTVFGDTANDPVTTGGEGDLGAYVAMYTPNGVIQGGVTGTTVNSSPLDFCLSVQNIQRVVRGVLSQRWVTVLRNCFNGTGGGAPSFALGTGTSPNTVTDPNQYQLWAPALATTTVPSPVSLVNEALLSGSFRHGIGGNDRYVLDDTAWGGTGTQLIAYPANGGINQQWDVIGCTPPVTQISGLAAICP